MKPNKRLEYAKRLQPVLLWLASHPDATPDLYRLADLACLSPYHFHRVYRAMMGETVAATAQRMRMHRASVDLLRSTAPTAQVSQRAGYESPAAFTRAFAKTFGLPPGRYREQRSGIYDLSSMETAMNYPVTVQQFPGATLCSLPHNGDYHKIGATFDQLYMLAGSRGLITPDASGFGIYYDDPRQVAEPALRSAAGVQIAPSTTLDAPLQPLEIPTLRCAVLEHTGPYSELEKAYDWLFGRWLPESGAEPGDFPMFEHYINDAKTTPAAELRTLIHFPLKA